MADIIKPTLYILMFKDVPDMNPGKGMAQASHASAKFVADNIGKDTPYFDEWLNEGRGFGTTCVLSVSGSTLYDNIRGGGFPINIIEDVTYPYKNWYGETFVMSIETCAYIFVTPLTPEHIAEYIKSLPLHP